MLDRPTQCAKDKSAPRRNHSDHGLACLALLSHGKRDRESRPAASHGKQRHRERGLQRVVARKVQTRLLERELPLSALDAILKSDFSGNRPEFSPHATKASSRRGRKPDATCSPGPATTGKNLKRLANGPISHSSQETPDVLGSFPRGSTAGEIFKCNSPGPRMTPDTSLRGINPPRRSQLTRTGGQCAHPDNGTRIAGSGRIVAYPEIMP